MDLRKERKHAGLVWLHEGEHLVRSGGLQRIVASLVAMGHEREVSCTEHVKDLTRRHTGPPMRIAMFFCVPCVPALHFY
jgi:hypothetical protein